MNKKQILASLNNIANTLDNSGLYSEANSLTMIMKRVADTFSDEDKDLLKHYPHEELHDSNLSAKYNDKQTIWLAVQKIESLLDQILNISENINDADITNYIKYELEYLKRMLDYSESFNQPNESSKNEYVNQVQDLVYKISEIYIQTMSKLNTLDNYNLKTFISLLLDEKINKLSEYEEDEDDYYEEDEDEEDRY